MENEHKILHLIKILTEKIEKRANTLLKDYDLTLAQGHMLRSIKKNAGEKCHLKELEKELNIAQSTSVGIVSRLEKKNFVKTYFDPNDKRIKIIEITDEGRVALDNIKIIIQDVEQELFAELTEGERIIFIEITNKIIKHQK